MIVPEIARHLSEIRALCQHYGLERMSVIGSATDKEKFSPETSDLDCLVKFLNEKDSSDALIHLTVALEKICQRPVEMILESTVEKALPMHPLRQIIEKSKVVIYNAAHDSR